MVNFTENEKRALLVLLKDAFTYHNSNSLSKKLNISRVGSMKILKKLEENNILKTINIGKSIVYKINFNDDYVCDVMTFLLSDESNDYKRWKNEFKELFNKNRIVIIFGSALINYSKANDIDLLVIGQENFLMNIINEKQKILSKKIHLINITNKEFLNNLDEKQKSIVEIIKTGIVLYGQSKYVELLKNVKII